MLQMKMWGVESSYREMGNRLGLTVEEATKLDWAGGYYF